MRGKYNWAVAVREPDGAIYVEEHDLNSGKDKNGWMYWPLVRGCRALVESLMLGFKALEIAALHAFGDEEGEQKGRRRGDRRGGGLRNDPDRKCPNRARRSADFGHREMVISMVVGPRAGCGAVHRGARAATNPIVGGVRRSHAGLEHRGRPSARGRVRVLHLAHRPHGGHQAHVHVPRRRAQGHPLLRARPSHDPENARQFPRLHVRCGTAFLIMVMVIAILVYTIFPFKRHHLRLRVPDGLPKLRAFVIVARIVLMPVIAGISYEITVKWAGEPSGQPA